MTEAPLAGITIVDLSRVLSGPYCTMLAADMGARVIKIEHVERGDDTRAWGPPFQGTESAYYLSINRNKESVALDFKRPEGRAILDRLIAKADVLVENFRPGTLDASGLGYATLSTRHPGLIYVSISGFGQDGPRRDEPGYDAVVQAEGGLMSITGMPDGPAVRLGVAIADIASGMFAFQGLLLAVIARARTGRGQWVDVGLLDSVTALLTYQASRHFATGEIPAWRLPLLTTLLLTDLAVRGSDGEPFFGAGEATLAVDTTLRLLERKFRKSYRTDAPNELLAYYVAAPPRDGPAWRTSVPELGK